MNRENGSAKRQIWIVEGEGASPILETAMEFRRIDPFKGTESMSANMAPSLFRRGNTGSASVREDCRRDEKAARGPLRRP